MPIGKDETRDMKKLAWGMFIALTIFGSGMFGVLANETNKLSKENKRQDTEIKQKTEETAILRMDTKNQTEHNEFRNSVNRIKDDVGELRTDVNGININVNNIKDDIGEIKELLKK